MNSLPYEIVGGWQSGERWLGMAKAAEPLVGIVFLNNGHETDWCKTSHRASEAGLSVELVLRRYGDRVHVAFDLGDSTRQHWTAEQEGAPDIPVPIQGRTYEQIAFTQIDGKPTLSLSLLLIQRSEIRSERTGLWAIRKQTRSGLTPWLEKFNYGRTGTF